MTCEITERDNNVPSERYEIACGINGKLSTTPQDEAKRKPKTGRESTVEGRKTDRVPSDARAKQTTDTKGTPSET